MSSKTTNIYIVIIAILTLVVGVFLGGKYDYQSVSKLLKKDTIYIKGSNDTLVKYQSDTLTITKTKIITQYRDLIDTFYITQSFTKIIDTTIDNARIEFAYYYPEDFAKIELQQKITEILRIDTIKTFAPLEIPVTDHKTTILTGVAGIGVGVLIGVLIAK